MESVTFFGILSIALSGLGAIVGLLTTLWQKRTGDHEVAERRQALAAEIDKKIEDVLDEVRNRPSDKNTKELVDRLNELRVEVVQLLPREQGLLARMVVNTASVISLLAMLGGLDNKGSGTTNRSTD